jgi:hypothetical protein
MEKESYIGNAFKKLVSNQLKFVSIYHQTAFSFWIFHCLQVRFYLLQKAFQPLQRLDQRIFFIGLLASF